MLRYLGVVPPLVLLAAGLAASGGVVAQTEAKGRAVFRQAGCTICHAYVSRVGAPSAKDMKAQFRGNSEGIKKGIQTAPTHATDPSLKAASAEQIQQVVEWLSGAWYQGGQGALAAASSPQADPVLSAAEAKKQARAKQLADAKTKREAESLARLEKMEQARKAAVARAELKREVEDKAKRAASDRAQRAADDQAGLKREAEDKARRAAEVRARSDAEQMAVQKREAEDLARRVAEAKAKNDQAAESRLKQEAEEKARLAATEKSRREAEGQLAAQRYAEELARREAELNARREAEEMAALKREAEERTRREAEIVRRENEAKSKREADAKAKREADALAAAKAPVLVAKAERGKLKAPERFRDEPCEPYTGPPVTNVDEAAAKAIMDRIDCGGCHAYVQKKTGPPLKKVFEKVKGNPACVIYKLKNNQEHNDEGVTGELKAAEFKILADYYATRAK